MSLPGIIDDSETRTVTSSPGFVLGLSGPGFDSDGDSEPRPDGDSEALAAAKPQHWQCQWHMRSLIIMSHVTRIASTVQKSAGPPRAGHFHWQASQVQVV